MLTLFHAPRSCSMGILYLLEQTDLPYQVKIVTVRDKANRRPDYLALNPKGKVPALRLGSGVVITEFPAIAYWIARTATNSGIWPDDLEAQTQTISVLEFIVSSLHMRGLTLVKMPRKFHTDPAMQTSLRAFGQTEVQNAIYLLSDVLGSQDFLVGNFGVADAAAFYALAWCREEGFVVPANLMQLHDRLMQRNGAELSAQKLQAWSKQCLL